MHILLFNSTVAFIFYLLLKIIENSNKIQTKLAEFRNQLYIGNVNNIFSACVLMDPICNNIILKLQNWPIEFEERAENSRKKKFWHIFSCLYFGFFRMDWMLTKISRLTGTKSFIS